MQELCNFMFWCGLSSNAMYNAWDITTTALCQWALKILNIVMSDESTNMQTLINRWGEGSITVALVWVKSTCSCQGKAMKLGIHMNFYQSNILKLCACQIVLPGQPRGQSKNVCDKKGGALDKAVIWNNGAKKKLSPGGRVRRGVSFFSLQHENYKTFILFSFLYIMP